MMAQNVFDCRWHFRANPAMAKRFKPVTPLLPGFEPEAEDPSAGAPRRRPGAPAEDRAAAMAAMLQPQDRPAGPPPESLAGQTVWVVDSHSLIHQVFHALPRDDQPAGRAGGGGFGFARDLLYLLEAKRPDFLFCAFDLPGKTFRHELYEQYKASRPAMHDDLVPQIASIHRLVEALGIPALGLRVVRGRRRAGHRRPADRASWAAAASSSPATRTAGN